MGVHEHCPPIDARPISVGFQLSVIVKSRHGESCGRVVLLDYTVCVRVHAGVAERVSHVTSRTHRKPWSIQAVL